jgi:hypothetical protein
MTQLHIPGNTSMPGTVNVKAFGAKGDGVTDDTAAFTNAINVSQSLNVDLIIPQGHYMLSSGITWNAGLQSIRGVGVPILDFTNMSTGYAITVNDYAASYSDQPSMHEFSNLKIIGPNSDSTTADCFLFQDQYGVPGFTLRNLDVMYFRDQFYWGNNVWCTRFYSVSAGYAHRNVLNFNCATNAGENLSFYGCTFYNATNGSNNANIIYVPPESASIDVNFYGCSFDYSNYFANINDGIFTFVGCHFENNASNPMFVVNQASGAVSSLVFLGGEILPTETSSIRNPNALIQINSSAYPGNYPVVNIRGTDINFGKFTGELVSVASGVALVSVNGGQISSFGGGGGTGYLSKVLNALNNGGFELGNLTGWSVTAGSYTVQAQGTTKRSGSYALQISGTGSGTGDLYQQLPCNPGQHVMFVGWSNVPSYTSGNVFIQANFLDWQGNIIPSGTTGTLATINASNGGWTCISNHTVAPPGTTAVQLYINISSFNGTAYLDDLFMSIS